MIAETAHEPSQAIKLLSSSHSVLQDSVVSGLGEYANGLRPAKFLLIPFIDVTELLLVLIYRHFEYYLSQGASATSIDPTSRRSRNEAPTTSKLDSLTLTAMEKLPVVGDRLTEVTAVSLNQSTLLALLLTLLPPFADRRSDSRRA